jgi:hypothetical protein
VVNGGARAAQTDSASQRSDYLTRATNQRISANLRIICQGAELADNVENEATSLLGMLSQALGKSEDPFYFDSEMDRLANSPPKSPEPQVASPIMLRGLDQQPPDTRTTLSATKIQDLLLQGLANIPAFPARGVTVTVYGSQPWNAMLNFAPGFTSSQDAVALRNALTEIVQSLRKTIDVEVS